MIPLRSFQRHLKSGIYTAWTKPNVKNVMPVLATGGGKTVLFGNILAEHTGYSIAMAHRQELTSQISLALARNGIRHRVIGQPSLIRDIVSIHMDELKRDYTSQQARTAVGGIDTILNLDPKSDLFKFSTLGVIDEGHHVLRDNKWGKGAELFSHTDMRWVLPTATACRADGKGLGRHADGIVDEMVLGPTMREMIDMGFLTDYRIFAPPSDLDLSHVKVSESTGDYVKEGKDGVRAAVKQSRKLVGDVVDTYCQHAMGKLGVTFAVDVEEAEKLALAFRARGVPAEIVTAKTPSTRRAQILKAFKRREVLQLVNVDLFGEGFDLPAIEVVSMARPTMSFSLFCQQFGRALRLMIAAELSLKWDGFTAAERLAHIAQSGKPRAIILDHVSNTLVHGLPDAARDWSLDRREKRSRGSKVSDVIPTTRCVKCTGVYERVYSACPYCYHVAEPAGRSGPDQVDGDILELTEEVLRRMRGEVARIDAPPPVIPSLSGIAAAGARNQHLDRQRAQHELREQISLWAGYQTHLGRGMSEIYRRFYFKFGIDVMSAQALGRPDAEDLTNRIASVLAADHVIRREA